MRRLRAAVLPDEGPGAATVGSAERTVIVVSGAAGGGSGPNAAAAGRESGERAVEVVHPDLSADDVTCVCVQLRGAGAALAERPVADVVEVLGRVGRRFADPTDPLRREALDLLPATSGLSPAMSEAVLDGMARDWTAERLLRMLASDLRDPLALDGFVPFDEGRRMAVGPRLCTQIVAGSVPGVGVNALLRSLSAKGPTLLKPGLGDVVLPVLFARGLATEDADLARSLAVVYWPGGSPEVERAALAEADVVTAYGSDATVAALRSLAPVTARFVPYHDRVSVGAVGREATRRGTMRATAQAVARAVAMFDQRGCVSPQLVHVEEGGEASAAQFAEALAAALSELEPQLPTGPLDARAASALQQVRGTLELLTGRGGIHVWHGGAVAAWTVVLSTREDPPELPPVPRLVRVEPLADADRLPHVLRPIAPHLQTLGVAGFGARTEALAVACGRIGVARVVPFEDVPFPPAWWRHDGRGPIADLVRWVDLL